MKTLKRRLLPRVSWPLGGVLLALSAGPGLAWAEDGDFFINTAEWKSDTRELRVVGKGRDRRTVTVVDASDPARVLGADRVDDEKWWVRARDFGSVPCRVRATQSDGRMAERNVNNAPATCTGGGGSEPYQLAIERARWNGRDRKLDVRGIAAPDGRVSVVNAYDSRLILGTSKVEDDGKWRLERERPSPVPCRIRVIQGDRPIVEQDVSRAPADCAPKQPGGEVIPEIRIGDLSVNEGDGNAVFTVSLSETTTRAVSVSYATSNASAMAGADYAAAGGTLTITAGDTSGSISVAVIDDADDEPNETFNVNLSGAVNGTVADNLGVGTIVDNDEPAPVNIPPSAVDDSYDTLEGVLLSVGAPGVLANDSDAEGDTLTAVMGADPVNGSLTLNPDGSFAYTPNDGFTGSDSFTYSADDGQDVSTEATVAITVTQVVATQCPDPLPTTLPEAHVLCTTPYTGPEVCVRCHEGEARDMHGSVHYQQGGAFPNVGNIPAGYDAAGERPAHTAMELVATGINTYCGSHENSPRFTCAGCHVGNGRFPMAQSEFETLPAGSEMYHEQLANIDCLTCHQEQYRRFPKWTDAVGNFDPSLFEDLTLENVTLEGDLLVALPGSTVVRTGLEGIPAVDPVSRDFEFAPAGAVGSLSFELPPDAPFAPMTITTEVAVQTVHATTRRSCLSCHASAGGGDGTKRGDLSSLMANPTVVLDQHMSPDGHNLTCSDCHSAVGAGGESHRVRGRGLDLRPNDVPERFTCDSGGCHSDRPHGDFDYRNPTEDTHAVKIACQTCHIPSFAKGVATEVARDWDDPHLSQTACNGRGGWLPREDKLDDLEPSYTWFDGRSEVYFMGEGLDGVPTVPLAQGVNLTGFSAGDPAYVLAAPSAILATDGTVDMALGTANPQAKLYPMKEHWGKLARHESSNTLIGHSTYDFFRTGDFAAAVESGMAQSDGMNAGDAYAVVPVHTFQTLNHGVEPSNNALGCSACHRPLNSGSRINLKADLGYGLRTGNSVVNGSRVSGTLNGDLDLICSQCHGNENGGRSFSSVHDRHVRDKRKDCASCHNFSRLDVRAGLTLNR